MKGKVSHKKSELGFDNDRIMQLFLNMKTEIFLGFLLSILFAFKRSSATYFVEIIIIFVLSSEIMKKQFSHLIIKLSKRGSNRMYEYVFSSIFTFFIFITIEFLLNRMYNYTFYAFICLLLFACGVLRLITKREDNQIRENKK